MIVVMLTALTVKFAVMGHEAIQSVRSVLMLERILLLPSSNCTILHLRREQSSECALFPEFHA